MAISCETVDEREPKRQASASVLDSGNVCDLDDAIWTSIVEFLPIPRDLQVADRKHYDARVSEVVATWKTLLSLRLVSRRLASLLDPQDQAVWRRLLLQSFDFSSGGGLNEEVHYLDHGLHDPAEHGSSSEDEQSGEDVAEDGEGVVDDISTAHQSQVPLDGGEQAPQLVAMRRRYQTTPDWFLDEFLLDWYKIGICHRPSQYGFLTMLQQQPGEGTWPEWEDPFTLFGDIVHLLQLPHGQEMMDSGEGGDTMSKFLAGPAEAGPSSRFYGFHVMKTLGYVPHVWHRGRGIGSEWKGFTEPETMNAAIEKQLVDEDGEDAAGDCFEDAGEIFEFPECSVGDANRLFRHIRHHYRDWRSVCCNNGADGYTPMFFVGESKIAPHRWTGYTGRKCWT